MLHVFVFGTVFLLIISSIGSYEAFIIPNRLVCGKLCHEVIANLSPWFFAWARCLCWMSCVSVQACGGMEKCQDIWVYSVLANKFPTPIPTPIADHAMLRKPAKVLLLKFYDRKMKYLIYLTDSNTEHVFNYKWKQVLKSLRRIEKDS